VTAWKAVKGFPKILGGKEGKAKEYIFLVYSIVDWDQNNFGSVLRNIELVIVHRKKK